MQNTRTALITGASQGLGKAIAKRLAEDGLEVYIAARNGEALSATANEIGATAIVCDVASQESLTKLYNTLPHVDVLVCNAGGPPAGTFFDITDEQWQDSFELTLMSVVRLVRMYLPRMQENKWGRIIAMTSTSVQEPIPNLVTSNTLRAAVTNLIKTVSQESGAHNVTANILAPGMFTTERLEKLLAKDPDLQNRINNSPMQRTGNLEEFAAAASYLASSEASFVNGSQLTVDGGLTHTIL